MMAAVCALPQLRIISRCVPHDGVRRGGSRHSPRINLLCRSSNSSSNTLRIEELNRGDIAWRRPSQGWCKGLGLPNRGSLRRVSKKFFVVEATSSESESEDHHVSILGQDVGKQQLQVGATATATILFSVSNRVLYKMALVPLKDYPFFLAQALTFGYVIVYSVFLLIRYQSGIVTREMLELPKLPFITLGALEALGLAAGMAAAANLSGASIPILTQVILHSPPTPRVAKFFSCQMSIVHIYTIL